MIKKYNEYINESIRDKMSPISDENINEIIDNLGFELYGVDLDEKGNYGQDLVDIYAAKNEDLFFKLGQMRKMGNFVIFYPDFKRIEGGVLYIYKNVDGLRILTKDEKINVILKLEEDKRFGNLTDIPLTYLEIIKKIIENQQ